MIVVGRADDAQIHRGSLSLRNLLEENDICLAARPPISAPRCGRKIVQALGTGALCTLTEAAIAAVRGNPGLSKLAARLGDEGRAIARAHGVDPDAAPKRPSGGQSSGLIAHKPSMLQDYERGRPMEVEAQLVATLAFARVANVRSSGAGNRRAAGRVQGGRQGPVRGLESPRDEEAEAGKNTANPRSGRAFELLERLPVPMFVKARDGRYLGVNKAWEELFGVPRASFVGKQVRDLYPQNPEIAELHAARDSELWERPGAQSYPTHDRHARWSPARHDLLQGDLSR